MARTVLGDVRGPADPRGPLARQRIADMRIALVSQFPFFGIIACKLQLVEDNVSCMTMATDGRHMFYNVNYIMGIEDPVERAAYQQKVREKFPEITDEQLAEVGTPMTDKEIAGGIVHETMHCMFEHFIRRNSREPNKWNRACDYAINQIIVRELGPKSKVMHIADIRKTWLFDPKYDQQVAEEIYKQLEDDESKGKGKGGAPMDHHYSGGNQAGGKDRGDVESVFSDSTDTEISEDMQDFKELVMSAAKAANNVPGELMRMIEELTKPRISWKTKLKRVIQSYLKRDMAFYRPSRRSWNLGCILPGYIPDETIDICIAIDLSGSITNAMAREMLSEVYGITKQFPQFKIKLLCFDTSVYNATDFDENSMNKFRQYKLTGGGGTDFQCVWDYMHAENYKPNQLVMFTDGYPCGSWGEPRYTDTLFVIHGSTTIKPPFGQHCYYEFQKQKEAA